MLYLVREYCSGCCALFDSTEKAEDFVRKLNDYLFKENGEGLSFSDYSLEKIEINPSFDKWIATN